LAESRLRAANDPARDRAAAALCEVLGRGRSLTAALDDRKQAPARDADRAFAQELAYGVMRWLPRLEVLGDALLQRPLRTRDLDVRVVVLLGLFQLIETRVPPHAVVHASVELARRTRKPWAGGLVNAVLRRWQRENWRVDDVAARGLSEDELLRVRLAHPDWLLRRLREDWPEHWESLCEANNRRPPMTVRVNGLKLERAAWMHALREVGLGGVEHPLARDAVMLEQPCAVGRLPGFEQGWVSVQDAAGQLAAALLAPEPGHRVLDACAAPGSKTCHLLERQPALAGLTALDADATRLQRLQESLTRLGLAERDGLQVRAADAGRPETWWDGRPYDRILLDVPCSATGVIRRHPDIKHLRRPDDIRQLTASQLNLLEALWPLLLPGGILLYSTCSVLRQENGGVLEEFLRRHADARSIDPARVAGACGQPWGLRAGPGRQILTGTLEMDGFYYGLLAKD